METTTLTKDKILSQYASSMLAALRELIAEFDADADEAFENNILIRDTGGVSCARLVLSLVDRDIADLG